MEQENKVGHSEASKRFRFPGCPLRGFQPSLSYLRATDEALEITFEKVLRISRIQCTVARVRLEPALLS